MAYSSCHFSSAFSYNLFSTTTSFANMWVVDSGETNHMCGSSSPLHNISNLSQPITMGFAEARSTSVHQMGSFRLNNVITLNNVLRIPTFTINLHFVSQLTTETRCTFLFLSNSSVQDRWLAWVVVMMDSTSSWQMASLRLPNILQRH